MLLSNPRWLLKDRGRAFNCLKALKFSDSLQDWSGCTASCDGQGNPSCVSVCMWSWLVGSAEKRQRIYSAVFGLFVDGRNIPSPGSPCHRIVFLGWNSRILRTNPDGSLRVVWLFLWFFVSWDFEWPTPPKALRIGWWLRDNDGWWRRFRRALFARGGGIREGSLKCPWLWLSSVGVQLTWQYIGVLPPARMPVTTRIVTLFQTWGSRTAPLLAHC